YLILTSAATRASYTLALHDALPILIEEVIKPVLPKSMIKGKISYLVNPTGAFEIGGPKGDCGVTGRKIIVDTYGGSAPHGGGARSEEHTSELQSLRHLVCRLLPDKK